MSIFTISGVTKAGYDLDVKVLAKNKEHAIILAGVYFELFAVIGGVK